LTKSEHDGNCVIKSGLAANRKLLLDDFLKQEWDQFVEYPVDERKNSRFMVYRAQLALGGSTRISFSRF
jgi:hypothetical protein